MSEYAFLNTDRTIRWYAQYPSQPEPLQKVGGAMVYLPVARETARWYERIEPPTQPIPADATEVRYRAVRRPDAELWAEIRARRDALLRRSDWTQLPDVAPTVNKVAWATYRQTLRDIPQTYAANPTTVVWPTAPLPGN